jgi:hypothetical protein
VLPRPLVHALLLAAALLGAAPRAAADEAAARAEAEAGGRAFSAGDYLGAAEAFGRAAGLDPGRTAYAVLRARALGELLAPGDLSKENLARLATVVSIYDGLLAAEPGNEEYAQAVPRLFEKAGDEAGRERWLVARAANTTVASPARADALRAAAEPLVTRAASEASAGRPAEAARLAGLARDRLDAALAIDAGSLGAHALRLHAFDLEIEAARAEGDAGRRTRLEAQRRKARTAADAAIARHPSLPSPDDY